MLCSHQCVHVGQTKSTQCDSVQLKSVPVLAPFPSRGPISLVVKTYILGKACKAQRIGSSPTSSPASASPKLLETTWHAASLVSAPAVPSLWTPPPQAAVPLILMSASDAPFPDRCPVTPWPLSCYIFHYHFTTFNILPLLLIYVFVYLVASEWKRPEHGVSAYVVPAVTPHPHQEELSR